jgi:cardiolipin synthase
MMTLAVLLAAAGCFPTVPDDGAPAPPPPSPASGSAMSLLVEPDDGPDPVLSIVRDAQRTVHAEMYLLTDGDAIQALIDSRQRGRQVDVILEPHPFQADGANQPAYDQLTAAGVFVTWASERFALTHAKLLLADDRRACVMTLNLTRAGLTSNREYAIVDDDPVDVADAAAIVAADRVGAPAPDPSASTSGGGAGGHLLASPANARARLADLLAGARRSVAVEMEELSDPALTGALIAAVARGAGVTVVLPGAARSAATDAAAQRLAGGGASVRVLATPTVHAKAIVVDGARLYIGSINLTAASMDANREFGLILDDAAAAVRVARTISADWARAGEL